MVSDISHLSENEQVEMIANKFAEVQNEYEPIQPSKIEIPNLSEKNFPKFSCNEVWLELAKLNPKNLQYQVMCHQNF